MKYIIILAALAMPAAAQVGVVIPQSNNSNFNYDEIRTSSGTTCRQAMGSNLELEAGVVGSDAGNDGNYFDPSRDYTLENSGGAIYGKVTYYFGAPKRLDCSRLYELEIQALRRQIESMRNGYALD